MVSAKKHQGNQDKAGFILALGKRFDVSETEFGALYFQGLFISNSFSP
jgi:hypothetical protein